MSNYAILSCAQLMSEVFLYLDMYIYRIYMLLRTSMSICVKVNIFLLLGHVGTNYYPGWGFIFANSHVAICSNNL